MRIAHLVVKHPLRGGGIEKYTYELGSRLVAKGHEVTVYSMTHYGALDSQINGMRIQPVFAFKKPSLQKLSASLSASLDVLFRGRYDIVHLHSVAAGAFGILPRMRGCKTVLQMHGIEWCRRRWGTFGSRFLKCLEKASIRQAAACTAVSRTQCDYLLKTYQITADYIPTAATIKSPAAPRDLYALGLQPDNYILFASRLVPEKGAHYLISAFRKLDLPIKLVVAGDLGNKDPYLIQLKNLATGDNRIIFPGFVEGRLLDELFSHARLYVQPSIVEGLSLSLLEAMSYGNCCLVSDIPENLEAIGDCGYSFKNQSIDDLSHKIKMLLGRTEMVDRIKSASVNRIRHYYSWELVTKQMETFYEAVVCGEQHK